MPDCRIDQLEKLLNEMKRDHQKELEEAFKRDFKSLLESTTFIIGTTPSPGLFTIAVPLGSEMRKRYDELSGGHYNYSGLRIQYLDNTILLIYNREIGLEMEIIPPIETKFEQTRKLILTLPHIDAYMVEVYINDCQKDIDKWTKRKLQYEGYLKEFLDSRNPIS